MATTQSQVTDQQQHQPFFWLRISGLPIYFFSTVRPGTDPFTKPTGYPTTTWAQHGMMLPDETVTQNLQDIIGGVATPERIRITLLDFDDPLYPGFGYLSRLLAPGRVLSSDTAQRGELMTNITADGSTSTFDVQGSTWTANSDVYVGAETIGVSQVANDVGQNTSRLTIQQRNKYPAYGTNQSYNTNYPPVPYHRVALNESDGSRVAGATVCDDVITIYGRAAALYMGHVKPDGTNCTEAEGACLLLGHITAVDMTQDGAGFQLTLESVTSDLDKALVAPDLPSAVITGGYYVFGASWNQFSIFTAQNIKTDIATADVWNISISEGRYTADGLEAAINSAMQNATALGASVQGGLAVTLTRVNVDGKPTWCFFSNSTQFRFEPVTPDDTTVGLYVLLGFQVSKFENSSGTGVESVLGMTVGETFDVALLTVHALATLPAAETVIPMSGRFATSLQLGAKASLLFVGLDTIIAGGQVLPMARLGDGSMVVILGGAAGGGAALNAGNLSDPDLGYITVQKADSSTNETNCYYVEPGQTATIEQVLRDIDDAAAILGRMLCSTTGVAQDSLFNCYPEGAGLGWNNIVNLGDFLKAIDSGNTRVAIIDRQTKFSDIYRPIAREYGLFLMWDPTDGLIHMRRIRQPSAAETQEGQWGSTFVFSESNRANVNDRTTIRQDRTSLRSSWKIQRGWDYSAGEFTLGPIIVNSLLARSFYPTDARTEELEDKTLMVANVGMVAASLTTLTNALDARSAIYQFPWMVWRRTVNKTGLMLSPGTYHQIVDNTIANPFTGARGITAADGMYVLLGGATKNYATGECTADLYAFSTADKAAGPQTWSPCGLIDFSSSGNGVNLISGSRVALTMASHYTNQTLFSDGIDFRVGDKVKVRFRHNDSGDQTNKSGYQGSGTISAITVDGLTVTLAAGYLGFTFSPPATTDLILMLDHYNSTTAVRKAGGVAPVAWQGDGSTTRIDGVTGTRLCKWQ